MKNKITSFIDSLINYDYILFGGILVFFIIMLIFSILARKKKKLSLFLVIFSFIFLFTAPFIGYKIMHNELFKNKTTLTSQKKLEFTKAVVIYGKLNNLSNKDFKSCLVTATVYRSSSNVIKNLVYKLKPLKKMSILQEDIKSGSEIDFKMIVSPFTYTGDFNTNLEANCR